MRRARASSSATPQNASEESASSSSNRAMSAVSPLGPGAAPRRERRRLVSKCEQSSRRQRDRCFGEPGQQVRVKRCVWQGRRSGSRSCRRVAWSPVARGSLSRARRAAESSPRWAKWTAVSARCSAPGSDAEPRAGGEAVEASRRSEAQSRLWKAELRARKTAAGMRGAACGRKRSIRGRNNHNVQARSDSTLVAAAARDWMCDKAKRWQRLRGALVRLAGWPRRLALGRGRQLQKMTWSWMRSLRPSRGAQGVERQGRARRLSWQPGVRWPVARAQMRLLPPKTHAARLLAQ